MSSWLRGVLRLLAASMALSGALTCQKRPLETEQEPPTPSNESVELPPSPRSIATAPTNVPDGSQRRAEERAACLERIRAARRKPALAGAPALDAVRTELLTRVKGEPLLFVEPPALDPVTDPGLLAYQRWLSRTHHPSSVLAQLSAQLQGRPKDVRAVVLRDGYLYAETLALAEALVRIVRAEQLFTEPEIWVQRGERVLVAERVRRAYRYRDGLEKGRLVRLLLFDRVGVGPIPKPVHRDVRALAYRLGFDRLRALHLTEDELVAELEYAGRFVPSLFEARGARLELRCEAVSPGDEEVVALRREERLRKTRAFRAVQQAVALQIEDRLPFDEPKHEQGQEDGKLRRNWIWAYEHGRASYRYHDDEYPVFDTRGRPQIPEVCVDFLLDTLERAGGTWWRAQGESRERVRGRFDFDDFDREALRRVPELVAFARAQPEWFEVLEIPAVEQIPMGQAAFLDYLAEHAMDFIPGDMLLVGGYVPWDRRRYTHYHSFFAFESDPMTGTPLVIAGNPGFPRLVPWQAEARRTPRRTLRYRIRPTSSWLETVVDPWPTGELTPPSLSSGVE